MPESRLVGLSVTLATCKCLTIEFVMTSPKRNTLLTTLILLAASAVAFSDTRLSVRDIMESALTPATNTLWGVEEPASDEDWQYLDDAAVVVIASMILVGEGGTGPSDVAWSTESDWRAWTADVIEAAEAARLAIAARDLDALVAATDAMYPPCEACHVRFHPGLE